MQREQKQGFDNVTRMLANMQSAGSTRETLEAMAPMNGRGGALDTGARDASPRHAPGLGSGSLGGPVGVDLQTIPEKRTRTQHENFVRACQFNENTPTAKCSFEPEEGTGEMLTSKWRDRIWVLKRA
eukprot:4952539-Karenia_brevis.AAC.1